MFQGVSNTTLYAENIKLFSGLREKIRQKVQQNNNRKMFCSTLVQDKSSAVNHLTGVSINVVANVEEGGEGVGL